MWRYNGSNMWECETHRIFVQERGAFEVYKRVSDYNDQSIHNTLQEAKDSTKPKVRPWTQQEACAAFGERGFDLSDGSKVLSLEVTEVLVLRPSGGTCYYPYLRMSKEHTFPGGTPCGFVENP